MSISLPTSSQSIQKPALDRSVKAIIALGAFGGIFVATLVALRILGLLYPFYIPTGSMAPAVSPGDHVIMEGITFLERKPRRGDIIAFRTEGIAALKSATIYDKRIVGEPGERVRISDGKLYVNDARVSITNSAGEIFYPLTEQLMSHNPQVDVQIPQDQYFAVGDNSTNSFDSRFWGCLPAKNIMGRIWICYWPPQRMGEVR
jgi:signal peptidase I